MSNIHEVQLDAQLKRTIAQLQWLEMVANNPKILTKREK